MTLAAGIPYSQGILLGVETELTIGDYKSHGVKLMPFDCPWGRIGIVCGGNLHGATAVMQKLRKKCEALSSSKHPMVPMEAVFRREYRETVWENPHFDPGNIELDFQLILVLQRGADKLEMFHSEDNYLLESSGPVCVGSGRTPAEHLINDASTCRSERGRLLAFMAQMFGFAKRHGSGVGGMTLFMDFGKDGTHAEFYGHEYLKTVEDFGPVFQMFAWELATAMGSPDLDDAEFEHSLSHFAMRLREYRSRWKDQRDFHLQHSNAYRLITDPKAPPIRKAPKRGR